MSSSRFASSRFASAPRPSTSSSAHHPDDRRDSCGYSEDFSSSGAAANISTSVSSFESDDDGLPLHSSQPRILSEPAMDRLREEERAEYLEVTRRRVLPKLVELAGRLVPAAAAELGGSGAQTDSGGGGLACASGHADAPPGCKTTGLETSEHFSEISDAADCCSVEGLEGGSFHDIRPPPVSPLASPFPTPKRRTKTVGGSGSGDREYQQLYLPQSAARLAAGQQTPLSLTEDGSRGSSSHGGVVNVETIAASLKSDVALLDYEADALLHTLQGDSNRERTRPSTLAGRDRTSSVDSGTSYDLSDDGMGSEIWRLNHVVDSLRMDLEGADLSALGGSDHTDSGARARARGSGGGDNDGGALDRRDLAGRRYGRTSRLAEQLQTWKYFGLQNGAAGGRSAALYWAVALVWAIVILLAGHVQLRQAFDGEGGSGMEDGWADVLGWIFSGRQ